MRDIIVIGGSAGAIDPLCALLKSLPARLPASVFVVIHVAEESSLLDQVLARCGRARVRKAANCEKVERGQVYVAPSGSHLVLNNGEMQLNKGPRENRHRPSVDTLFRSAARAHRERVIAIVLSGALDDGTAGALAVKARGGVVIVQSPQEAKVPDMPKNVLKYVEADYTLPVDEIAPRLVKLMKTKTRRPAAHGKNGNATQKAVGFVCPDCGGPLTQTQQGKLIQFGCRVGHKFSPQTVSEAHANALERALWVALRHLSERRGIQHALAGQCPHDPTMVRRYEENAEAATHDIALLREILERL